VIVNGHGGNAPVASFLPEWTAAYPPVRVKFWNWWNAPRTWAAVQAYDPLAGHASWMENFQWTRVAGPCPRGAEAGIDVERLRLLRPAEAKELLADGNFGGSYMKPDADMARIWQVAIEETREVIGGNWKK
jgi:creatinine amidohydrolase